MAGGQDLDAGKPMTSDLDVYTTAKLLLRRHGEAAFDWYPKKDDTRASGCDAGQWNRRCPHGPDTMARDLRAWVPAFG